MAQASAFNLLDRTVTNLMNRYGTPAKVLIAGTGIYNHDTQVFAAVDTEFNVNAMFFDLSKSLSGIKDIANSLIQEGDKQVFIQPTEKASVAAAAMPVPQANKDRIKIGNKIYKVVSVKQLNSTMDNCLFYECYCRE